MLKLHRLGHQVDEFLLNPDAILTIEANPDTVITLTNDVKIIVAEPPDRVAAKVREYRIEILEGAMRRRRSRRAAAAAARAESLRQRS